MGGAPAAGLDLRASAPLRLQCHERRREEVRAAMREHDVDVLVAYGWGRHSFHDINPAWYLSGLRQLGPHCAVLLGLDGDPIVVTTPARDQRRAEAWVTAGTVIAVDDFDAGVRDALAGLRAPGGRVGLASGAASLRAEPAAWEPTLGAVPVDLRAALIALAARRDAWSVALATEAARIAELTHARLLETLRPGVPEYRVHAEVEAHTRELGADDNFLFMSAEQHNTCVHTPGGRVVEHGDILLAELTPGLHGEFAQVCRSIVVGREPSQHELDDHALLRRCLERGLDAARPGTAVSDVVRAINQPLVDAGLERYTKPPYMRARGHAGGIGAIVPDMAITSEAVLDVGMTFVMHPNQYLPASGYLLCGEPVTIAPDGARILTSAIGRIQGAVGGAA